jgi:hypothetical protein
MKKKLIIGIRDKITHNATFWSNRGAKYPFPIANGIERKTIGRNWMNAEFVST